MNQPTFEDILDKIEDNDPKLTTYRHFYNLLNHDDFSALGVAIGENTYLTELEIHFVSISQDDDISTFQALFDGLKHNSSICKLHLKGDNRNALGDVGIEILRVYQDKRNQLTHLIIDDFLPLQQNGGGGVITDALSSYKNLKTIDLYSCSITDEQLLPMIDAVRGHRQLEELILTFNSIGNVGCETLVTLLEEPNCNIKYLDLQANIINLTHDGASNLANGLANNTKLKKLILGDNPIETQSSMLIRVLWRISSHN